MLAEIIRKTDGIPLFVEELTKTVLQSGLLEDAPAGYRLSGPLPALAIPSTLAGLADGAARPPGAGQGGGAGRRGDRARVRAPPAGGGAARCRRPSSTPRSTDLVRSELVFRRGTAPDATYSFKHALVRDTAYNSMLKSQRVLRHAPDRGGARTSQPDATTQPELLAYHHQEGGNAAAALRYWQAAGDQAMARSAVREAVTHYQAAVALLGKVQAEQATPDVELGLRFRLGNALVPDRRVHFAARPRASQGPAISLRCSTDLMSTFRLAAGSTGCLTATGGLGEALATLERVRAGGAGASEAGGPRRSSWLRLGYLAMLRGELASRGRAPGRGEARAREGAARRAAPDRRGRRAGRDSVVPRDNLSLPRSLSAADACAREALAIAEQRQHSNNGCWRYRKPAAMSNLKGDWTDSIKRCTRALELAERYGLKVFGSWTKSAFGRALVATGQLEEGMRLLREGYSAWTALAGIASTLYAADAADALLDAGCRDEAIEFMRSGEKIQHETGEV